MPQFKVAFARLSSGTKMLLILSAALLPLGIIAMLTSIDSARAARHQRLASAQTATEMYATQIDAVIDARFAAVRTALASELAADTLCAMVAHGAGKADRAVFPIALFDRAGHRKCQYSGTPIPTSILPAALGEHVWLDVPHGLLRIAIARADRAVIAETEVRLADIPLKIAADNNLALVSLSVEQGQAIAEILKRPVGTREDQLRLSARVAGGALSVATEFQAHPIQSRTILLIILPLLMWVAAAATGWFIVKRLLLLPLSQLQHAIDRFRTGQGPLEIPRLTTPSQEIQELAAGFAIASRRIITHEQELEEGLARQTKLTREVHHRVKNNLQVVSSLINLHARGATEQAATEAYAAIQRRVDALAVVHRNHYAELEENRGVALRTLAGELVSNLRASAPPKAAAMPIAIDMMAANVSQDIAVPVAFLITEIVELMMSCNPTGSVLISLAAGAAPDRARLRIETMGLGEGLLDECPGIARFDRITTGLARQLRGTLEQDRQAGRFEIDIAILD